jgi:hypothetical protein
MEQSLSWEANIHSCGHKISDFYRTWRFIIVWSEAFTATNINPLKPTLA